MSHRKRVRAYWNRVAREKAFERLKAALPGVLKQVYPSGPTPHEFVYKGAPLLGLLPKK